MAFEPTFHGSIGQHFRLFGLLGLKLESSSGSLLHYSLQAGEEDAHPFERVLVVGVGLTQPLQSRH